MLPEGCSTTFCLRRGGQSQTGSLRQTGKATDDKAKVGKVAQEWIAVFGEGLMDCYLVSLPGSLD